jgi:hypothetical protein
MMRESPRICNSFQQKQLCDTGCTIALRARADGNNRPLQRRSANPNRDAAQKAAELRQRREVLRYQCMKSKSTKADSSADAGRIRSE